MKVTQIWEIMNTVTSEVLGKTDLVAEDLSNIVDVGDQIFGSTNVDNYVKKLVDRIAKVVFVNRPYSGNIPSVLMDSWDYGAVVEKVSAELPDAVENESWELENGGEYNPNIFYKPAISAKFFNNKVTFEIDMSFTERQVKGSFSSASEINSFLTMIQNAVEKSFTVKLDGLIMRTINNMIGETFNADTAGIKAVNLLEGYNAVATTPTTAAKALTDKEFIRYASMQMALYIDRLSRISTLFNVGGKDRFTPADMLNVVMLSDFKAAANSYLQSDTFHNEYTKLPNADTVPYWQGSGTDYAFSKVSAINVKTSSGATVAKSGILAVMFDHEALGVSNLDRRVTTHFNPKGEFYNNFFKMDCGAFNDLDENFVVFYVEDATA
jgi:hypothetical protein